MKTPTFGFVRSGHAAVGCLILIVSGAFLAAPLLAEEKASASPAAASTGMPSEEQMMAQMMEMAKLNEHHKMLADLVGTWDYTVKMWMNPDPKAEPTTSKGVGVRKAIMGGRYFTFDVTGQMEMPGPDGKMQEMEFKGTALEGYDNAKKKFVSTWADNMSTGIMMSEGTYDPASKTFTYTAEMEMMPGQKAKVREVVKIIDQDHHVMEWYDNMRGSEAKTMEITYSRQK